MRRNLRLINDYLDKYGNTIIDKKDYIYLLRINHLYDQQQVTYKSKTYSITDRLVSIHQPYVRPIVREKRNAKVKFESKIQVTLTNGLAYLDHLSWDAFNEGILLQHSVEEYKTRTGHYPKEVLANKTYCNRENREWLKEKGKELKAKTAGKTKGNVKSCKSSGKKLN